MIAPSVVHIDAVYSTNFVRPGGMAIIVGDAPVWRYCKAMYAAIREGAAVVAIAHGLDDADPSKGIPIVAYSQDEDYRIGQPIPKGLWGIGDDLGDLPEF